MMISRVHAQLLNDKIQYSVWIKLISSISVIFTVLAWSWTSSPKSNKYLTLTGVRLISKLRFLLKSGPDAICWLFTHFVLWLCRLFCFGTAVLERFCRLRLTPRWIHLLWFKRLSDLVNSKSHFSQSMVSWLCKFKCHFSLLLLFF